MEHPTFADESLLAELVSQWQRRRAEGREATAAELCRDRPALAVELQRRLAQLERMNRLADSTQETLALRPTGPVQLAELPSIPGYEVLGELGRGGMGVVYKARQQGLGRLVALKMILHAGYAAADARQRFRGEAEAIARLQHPNIVQIYEVGEHDGCPYSSLEFCPGGSLAEQLAGSVLAPRRAAEWVAALAAAMQTAHEAGVIHRDLKPGNVLLAANGSPKITDFGLAKKLGEVGDTVSGSIIGTPSYMAPEQARGEIRAIGPTVDVYALGAILYECLTGRPPFRGASHVETIEQVCGQEPVPPRRLQPRVPHDLETICLKCLQKDARKRFRTARELGEDLGRFLRGEPIHARPVGRIERAWRWCRRQPAAAALVALSALSAIALLGGGFWYSARLGAARGEATAADARAEEAEARAAADRELAGTREYFALLGQIRERAIARRPGWTRANLDDLARAADRPPAAANLPQLRSELAIALTGLDVHGEGRAGSGMSCHALAYDPQGRWLALGEQKNWASCTVVLADVHTGRALRSLSFPSSFSWQLGSKVQDGARALAFSPDGRWLVVGARSGMLHRWDLEGEATRPESWQGHGEEVRRLAFAPDGSVLYSVSSSTLRRWDVEDGWRKTAEVARAANDLALGPAAEWLACADDAMIRILTPDKLTPLRPDIPIPASRLAASPDGHTLAAAKGDTIRIVDVRTGEALRTLRAPESETSHDSGVSDLTFDRDGTLLLSMAGWTGEVRLWDLASGRLQASWVVGGGVGQAAFRSDGNGLAVLAERGAVLYKMSGREQAAVAALSARPVATFAPHPGGDGLASLAAAVRPSFSGWDLTWWPLTGEPSPPSRLCALPPAACACLDFSPDGRQLLYTAGKELFRGELVSGRFPSLGSVAHLRDARFASDNRPWMAASGEVSSWEPTGQQPAARWKDPLAAALSGLGAIDAVAPGRRWVVAAGQNGSAQLLRASDAVQMVACPFGRGPLSAAALNSSETLAAVGTQGGEVILLEVPSGRILARLVGHTDAVTSLAFAGEALLASGSRDRTVRLTSWDGDTMRPLFTLPVGGPVKKLAFLAGEPRLAVLVHHERAVRLWHLGCLWPKLDALGSNDPLPPLPRIEPATETPPLPPPMGE